MRLRFTRQAAEFALSQPRLAFLLASGRLSYEEVLRILVRNDLDLLKSQVDRILNESDVPKLSEASVSEILQVIAPATHKSSYELLSRWHVFLYVITRIASPTIVVETGVLYGFSSAVLLAAIGGNRLGSVISVDLPVEKHKSVIAGRKCIQVGIDSNDLSVGCAVPFRLRSRWSLRLGDSLELLPKILDETHPISIFVHDSLHTYDHMMAEFRLGYDALEPGGLLISDDIGYNSAWHDFCELKKEDSVALSKGSEAGDQFGFLVKS